MDVIQRLQSFIYLYRMRPRLLSQELQHDIIELFFPDGSEELDIGPSSSSPFAKELAQLFVHGAALGKSFLSRGDVLEGFFTMATAYARRTSSIQVLGNALFGSF